MDVYGNRNYNKIWEEKEWYKLFDRLIYSTSKLDAEKDNLFKCN